MLNLRRKELHIFKGSRLFGEILAIKAGSAAFLQVCFVCLKESTCETRNNIFYFTSKALLLPEIIKSELFKCSNVMASSNA